MSWTTLFFLKQFVLSLLLLLLYQFSCFYLFSLFFLPLPLWFILLLLPTISFLSISSSLLYLLQFLLFLHLSHFKYNIQVQSGQWFSALLDPWTPLEGWLMIIMIMMMKRVCTLTMETVVPFQDTASAMNNITVTIWSFFCICICIQYVQTDTCAQQAHPTCKLKYIHWKSEKQKCKNALQGFSRSQTASHSEIIATISGLIPVV